jgi:hypothetical protein
MTTTTQSVAEMKAALKAQLEQLEALTPQVKADKSTVKIGDKGTVNIYGMGRFPVCLYIQQVDKLSELFESDTFKHFIASNQDKLSRK